MTNLVAAVGVGFRLDNVSAHRSANLVLNPTYDVGVVCSGSVEFAAKFQIDRSRLVRRISDGKILSEGTTYLRFSTVPDNHIGPDDGVSRMVGTAVCWSRLAGACLCHS
jgi:hypothetical protein